MGCVRFDTDGRHIKSPLIDKIIIIQRIKINGTAVAFAPYQQIAIKEGG
jgi:hypothetical protein